MIASGGTRSMLSQKRWLVSWVGLSWNHRESDVRSYHVAMPALLVGATARLIAASTRRVPTEGPLPRFGTWRSIMSTRPSRCTTSYSAVTAPNSTTGAPAVTCRAVVPLPSADAICAAEPRYTVFTTFDFPSTHAVSRRYQ